jgi:hypothetical protein
MISGAVAGGVSGAGMGAYRYESGPGPHTVVGLVEATAVGGAEGAAIGGVGGAVGHGVKTAGKNLRAVKPVPIGKAAGDNQYVDVLDPRDRVHILDGDAGGGGHRWPGAPDKTPFPQNWTDDQIIHNVGDIVTDPTTTWHVQTGSGGMYTQSEHPAVWRAWEVRDGIRIRVAYKPATGRVPTAFPDQGPATGAVVP